MNDRVKAFTGYGYAAGNNDWFVLYDQMVEPIADELHAIIAVVSFEFV
jgi:hypothetical protein